MRFGKFASLGLALGAMLLHGSLARADFTVTYIATGTFTGGTTSGTSIYTQGPLQISFTSLSQSVILPTANPVSLASFGTFNTNGTTSNTPLTPITGSPTFTLTIQQLLPTAVGPPSTTFLGSLQGSLGSDTSGAFIQFAAPLSKTINSTLGPILYQILSNDNSTPGRVNINPKSTNGGLSTIAGQVSAVPEPTSLMLMALGCPIVLGIVKRSRRIKASMA